MHPARLAPLVMLAACSFAPGIAYPDGASPDTAIDQPVDTPLAPASCQEVLAKNPAAASGTYEIDPDGQGPDAPVSVVCDMTTQGGGWTIVFLPSSANLDSPSVAYSAGTPRLMTDASEALMAYRDAANAVVPGYASFPLPAMWQSASPLSYDTVDLATMVSIDGGAASSHTLRFGNQSFFNVCGDPWLAMPYGRICIQGTAAPFYNGFAAPDPDDCPTSQTAWSARACTANVMFSIAVR